jgi:hypothetical protein
LVSEEPEVEVDAPTSRIETADQGCLVPANAARQQIQRWYSKSTTTETF